MFVVFQKHTNNNRLPWLDISKKTVSSLCSFVFISVINYYPSQVVIPDGETPFVSCSTNTWCLRKNQSEEKVENSLCVPIYILHTLQTTSKGQFFAYIFKYFGFIHYSHITNDMA